MPNLNFTQVKLVFRDFSYHLQNSKTLKNSKFFFDFFVFQIIFLIKCCPDFFYITMTIELNVMFLSHHAEDSFYIVVF